MLETTKKQNKQLKLELVDKIDEKDKEILRLKTNFFDERDDHIDASCKLHQTVKSLKK